MLAPKYLSWTVTSQQPRALRWRNCECRGCLFLGRLSTGSIGMMAGGRTSACCCPAPNRFGRREVRSNTGFSLAYAGPGSGSARRSPLRGTRRHAI